MPTIGHSPLPTIALARQADGKVSLASNLLDTRLQALLLTQALMALLTASLEAAPPNADSRIVVPTNGERPCP